MTEIKFLSKNIKENNRAGNKQQPVLKITQACGKEIYCNEITLYHGCTVLSDRANGSVYVTALSCAMPFCEPLDGTIKRIHVNQHHLMHNLKYGQNLKPLITMKVRGKAIYADTINILGKAKIVYSLKPLSCGANLWVETKSDVLVLNPTSFLKKEI